MRKIITTFILTLSLLLGCLCPAQAGTLSRSELYDALQTQLHYYLEGEESMPLDDLVREFGDLGIYRKNAAFSYYVTILRDVEAGVYEQLAFYTTLLRKDEEFCALLIEEEFPSVDELEAYALGRQAEESGDWPTAIAQYEKSIAVLDSMWRIASLCLAEPTATPTPTPTPVPTPTLVPTPTPTHRPTPTPIQYKYSRQTTADGYEIQTYKDGTCAILRYKGNATKISIPQTLLGYRVTAIEMSAFARNTSITSVTPPYGLTSIGSYAFNDCTALVSIDIPGTVTSIGNYAFQRCTSLTRISLPASLTRLGSSAFADCSALTSVMLPSNITRIEDSAFRECTALSFVDIPKTVTFIGAHAFSDCDALTSVIIPDSVTEIGSYAFSRCDALTTIILPDSVTTFGTGPFDYSEKLTLRVKRDSLAHRYAVGYRIPFTIY